MKVAQAVLVLSNRALTRTNLFQQGDLVEISLPRNATLQTRLVGEAVVILVEAVIPVHEVEISYLITNLQVP